MIDRQDVHIDLTQPCIADISWLGEDSSEEDWFELQEAFSSILEQMSTSTVWRYTCSGERDEVCIQEYFWDITSAERLFETLNIQITHAFLIRVYFQGFVVMSFIKDSTGKATSLFEYLEPMSQVQVIGETRPVKENIFKKLMRKIFRKPRASKKQIKFLENRISLVIQGSMEE